VVRSQSTLQRQLRPRRHPLSRVPKKLWPGDLAFAFVSINVWHSLFAEIFHKRRYGKNGIRRIKDLLNLRVYAYSTYFYFPEMRPKNNKIGLF
jgi:hypothetical protein